MGAHSAFNQATTEWPYLPHLRVRGDQAAAADVGCLADAALYSARRHSAPLAVACSGARLGGQQMLAALLSNDQASGAT